MADIDQQVAALSDIDLYDAKNVELLENQVASGSYSSRACRGLLRLYQLNPSLAKLDTIVLVLVKSLSALPEPDFIQAVCLLPAKHQTETVKALIELDTLLQKAQFGAFWDRAAQADLRPVLDRVAGFDDSIRKFIVNAINRTYQKVEKSVLQTALKQTNVDSLLQQHGWQTEGSLVVLPMTESTAPRPKRADELQQTSLKASDVSSFMNTLIRGI